MSDIVEMLREFATDYTTTTYHDELIREAAAEIERLRADLEDQRKDTVCDEQRIADLMADVQRQGQEIERLRGLLREIREIGWLQAPHPLTQRICETLGDVSD